MKPTTLSLVLATVLMAPAGFAGQAQQSGAALTDTAVAGALEVVHGTITAIDADNRVVTLDIAGKQVDVSAGDEMRNFDQLRVGDDVEIDHVKSVAVHGQTSDGEPSMATVSTTAIAPLGGKPAITTYHTTTLTADVIAIDRDANTVDLRGPGGDEMTLAVGANSAALDTILVGDQAMFEIVEAYAIKANEQ